MTLLLMQGVAFAQNDISEECYVVDEILVEGVRKTRPKVVLRQLTFVQGDTICTDDLEALVSRNEDNVYNLGLFTKVETELDTAFGRFILRITVEERWYVFPSPYVDLEERTFNEWWEDKDLDRLVVGLGLDWSNFTGWNDRLYLYGQWGYSRRITMSYRRPFLFPKPQIDGSVTFFYVNNREIGYNTINGVLQLARLNRESIRQYYIGTMSFAKRLSPREQIQASIGYQHFDPNDSIVFFNDRYLTDGAQAESYPSISLGYVRDERDIRSFPLDGFKYAAGIKFLGLPGWGTSRFAKANLSLSHHIPLTKRWNFAYGMQNFFLLGKEVPYYDKYFIGFGSFLRGYERYVIDGSYLNLTKAEWKYGIFPRKMYHAKWIPSRRFRDFPFGLYLSAFADAGYVTDNTFNNQDNYLKNKLLLGYGLGVNVTTVYDFLVRFEYSFNKFGQGGFFISGRVPIQ